MYCMYVHTYKYTCIDTYTVACLILYICTCVFCMSCVTHIQSYIHIQAGALRIHIYIHRTIHHTYINTRIHAGALQIHIYIYTTYIHKHTHTCRRLSNSLQNVVDEKSVLEARFSKVCMYYSTYVCVFVCVCMYIYIYIY